jgi:AbrB family looped-hinge helix DNA binding protein
MITSKLTDKYQATVPKEVRRLLNLKKGDRIAFRIEGEQVILQKVMPFDVNYIEAITPLLSEWSSGYDEEAYLNL